LSSGGGGRINWGKRNVGGERKEKKRKNEGKIGDKGKMKLKGHKKSQEGCVKGRYWPMKREKNILFSKGRGKYVVFRTIHRPMPNFLIFPTQRGYKRNYQ
jgi:hypothetical protein